MEEKLNLTFFVAGVKFRKGWKDNLRGVEEGQTLQLIPEPTNKFDKDAVQIATIKGDVMLGYVPAKTGEAVMVSNAIKRGAILETTVTVCQPDFEPWTALEVNVKEVEKTPSVIMHGRTREVT